MTDPARHAAAVALATARHRADLAFRATADRGADAVEPRDLAV